jgi:hypothetical protein
LRNCGQGLALALELLQQVGLQIRARATSRIIEQRGQRHVMLERMRRELRNGRAA